MLARPTACLLLLAAACAAPPAPPTPPAAPAPLTPAEQTALADSIRAFAAEMVATIDRHDVDGFIGYHQDGPGFAWATWGAIDSLEKHRRSMKQYFPSDAGKNVHFTLGESTVYVIDRNAAALTGIINSTNVDATGKPTTGHEAWSIVVHRLDGRWKVVQVHESYPRPVAGG